MQSKSTTSNAFPQQVIAGMNLKNPDDIEFFGIRKNKTVQYLQAGQVHYFGDLAPKYYVLLHAKLYADKPALEYFRQFDIKEVRKVELYTYFLYGSLDHKPDIINGVLQPSENFRHTSLCPSLKFSGKDITIDGVRLTLRDLTIIDMSARECGDYEIAQALGITESTLGFHKKQLFTKTRTQCKIGLVAKSFLNKII